MQLSNLFWFIRLLKCLSSLGFPSFLAFFAVSGDAGSVFVRIFPDADNSRDYNDVWYAQGSQGKAWSAKSAPIGKRPAGFKVYDFCLIIADRYETFDCKS